MLSGIPLTQASIIWNIIILINPDLIWVIFWKNDLVKIHSGIPVPYYLIPAWLHIEGMYTKLCWKDDEGAQEKTVKLTTMNVNMFEQKNVDFFT